MIKEFQKLFDIKYYRNKLKNTHNPISLVNTPKKHPPYKPRRNIKPEDPTEKMLLVKFFEGVLKYVIYQITNHRIE